MPEAENGVVGKTRQRNEVYRMANELSRRRPDWVTFFREILGLDGIIRRTYRTPEALAEFERTDVYAEILGMLTRLRERPLDDQDVREPVQVITVRVPRSIHDALREEAHERRTSMNQLCISKLLQSIENELIPDERWRLRSGRDRGEGEKRGAGADV